MKMTIRWFIKKENGIRTQTNRGVIRQLKYVYQRFGFMVVITLLLVTAFSLSGCSTSGSVLKGEILPPTGTVTPSDLDPKQIYVFSRQCHKYDVYWSGDIIRSTSAGSRRTTEVGAIMFIPKKTGIKISRRGWRYIGCPTVREMINRIQGSRDRLETTRPRMLDIRDERGLVIGHVYGPIEGGVGVIGRGKSSDGRRIYEVTSISKPDTFGPGGGGSAGGGAAGGGSAGGGGGGGR